MILKKSKGPREQDGAGTMVPKLKESFKNIYYLKIIVLKIFIIIKIIEISLVGGFCNFLRWRIVSVNFTFPYHAGHLSCKMAIKNSYVEESFIDQKVVLFCRKSARRYSEQVEWQVNNKQKNRINDDSWDRYWNSIIYE